MASPALHISGLQFSYRAGDSPAAPATSRPLITLPDLKLNRGEQVLLAGASGSGKSTLLHLIAGLIDPEQGRVEIDGQSISGFHGAARDRFRGRHIGIIFQTFHLLPGFSAIENVMAALKFSARPRREHASHARALLAQLGIERPMATPDQLSVGQQQRVAVARALACDPVLVLADEPTASLDPANAAAAMDLIQRACTARQAALLCTSHDPSLKARFARHVELN